MSRLPAEWVKKRPLERYETQFLYTGLSRYDTVKKTLSSILRTADGKTIYKESPYGDGPLARGYISEHATVTVYSISPRVWVEDLGVNEQSVFIEL